MTFKYLKTLTFLLFYLIFLKNSMAQSEHLPIRIEKKTEKYTETNSKYGTHTRVKTHFEVIYKDSTREILTNHKLKDLLKSVPEAQIEWKKYKTNSIYKISSLPLFAAGFIGAIQFIDNDLHKKRNATISILGLAGGAWVFNHFDHKKQRNRNMIISYCNKKWGSLNTKSNLKDIISPDVMRVGSVENNAVGLGFIWYLDSL